MTTVNALRWFSFGLKMNAHNFLWFKRIQKVYGRSGRSLSSPRWPPAPSIWGSKREFAWSKCNHFNAKALLKWNASHWRHCNSRFLWNAYSESLKFGAARNGLYHVVSVCICMHPLEMSVEDPKFSYDVTAVLHCAAWHLTTVAGPAFSVLVRAELVVEEMQMGWVNTCIIFYTCSQHVLTLDILGLFCLLLLDFWILLGIHSNCLHAHGYKQMLSLDTGSAKSVTQPCLQTSKVRLTRKKPILWWALKIAWQNGRFRQIELIWSHGWAPSRKSTPCEGITTSHSGLSILCSLTDRCLNHAQGPIPCNYV